LTLVRTGYLATLTALPDGARRRGNVEKLIEKAEASGKITLGAFTEYLDDLSTRETREGEAALETKGAVTLMTVHASKGLEFPVVVLADASWTRRGGGGSVIIPDHADGLACKVYDETTNKAAPPFSYRRATYREKLLEAAERKRLLYVAATRAQDYLLISGQSSRKKGGVLTVTGWLGQIWELLELGDEIHPQREPIIGAYDWGNLRFTMPSQIPDREQLILGEANEESAWESATIRSGEALTGTDEKPLLLNPIEVEPDAPARHLSATQIADIGAAGLADNEKDRLYYRDRIRKRIFYDAPAHIPTVTEQSKFDDTKVPKHKIGEMVHEALRYWRFPTAENDLTDMLESYAWKQGIINPDNRQSAIRQAQQLLKGFVGTKVYNWVQKAQQLGQPIYYELPFIYRTEKRTIHGIIDLLFQRSDGVWVIVDYKTSFVGKAPLLDEIAAHARRYHLQIGVYAAAVQAQIGGSIPEAYIHYIRYSRAVPIATEDWREALENLENLIGRVV
jgi:ATP-dependent helicase/nuclease subunit A